MYAANYKMLRDLAIRHAQVDMAGDFEFIALTIGELFQ